jgi:hypothetical protein
VNAPRAVLALEAGAAEAVIVGAEIAAGHDGTAEMAVRVQYENGVTAPVVLDQATGLALMRACGVASLDGLIGRSWRESFKRLTGEDGDDG